MIAGGGTGGHVIPALAIAGALKSAYGAEVCFLGTARGMETRLVPQAGYQLELIDVGQLNRVSLATQLKTLVALPRGIFYCMRLLRNWQPQRYAAVMDHAAARGWRVVLIGGPSPDERSIADAVLTACRNKPLDLTGKDTLKKLMAMFCRAQLLLTPDSGPMHMANTLGMKVLGLHAASNPARSGPYSDRRWCVDKYDAASRKYFGKPASEIPWGSKIERPGVMDLIAVDDVIERFEAAAATLIA